MIKLCEEGYIMSISDYPIYQKIPFDAPDDYKYPYINLDVFFKDKSSKNKFDILMYEGYANNYHIRLPLTESICKSICDHVKEKVSFIFNDTYNDTPCTDENIEKVDIPINYVRDAIYAYIQYISYKLLDQIPYADSSADHMPTLETVLINDEPSNFFDEITNMINEHIEDVTSIEVYKNGNYKYMYDNNNDSQIETKPKKLKLIFIRLNSKYPLFYVFKPDEYKLIKKLKTVELCLSWYNNDDYLTEYRQSVADDYIYSGSELHDVLTLDAVFGYIQAYYMRESKNLLTNRHLIITMTGYYKLKNGMIGIRAELYETDIVDGSFIDPLMIYYAARQFLTKEKEL